MSKKSLPSRPDLGWLKKRSKSVLDELRRERPEAKLAEAQRIVAREHGFASWRALKQEVEARRAGPSTPPDLPEETVAAFLRAVGVGERETVEVMLRDEPQLVHAVGPHPFWGGRPQALHVAIDTDRIDMVKLLLKHGADVNGRNDAYSHWSPLLLSVGKRRGSITKLLLKHGARIGLTEALAMGDDVKALRMLRRGRAALPEHTPGDGSLLGFARTPAAIDRLLALGVSTELRDRWGASPIEILSRLGRRGTALVRHLQARGVETPPEVFARIGDRRTLARLIADDPSVLANPLVIKGAVDFGQLALARWLLERGADPNARSNAASHDTCLHSAAWNGNLEMVELLLQHGADPRLRDHEHDGTPAGWADVAVEVTNNAACREVAERLRAAERDALT
jgi:ankyrin repeat protein